MNGHGGHGGGGRAARERGRQGGRSPRRMRMLRELGEMMSEWSEDALCATWPFDQEDDLPQLCALVLERGEAIDGLEPDEAQRMVDLAAQLGCWAKWVGWARNGVSIFVEHRPAAAPETTPEVPC